MELTRHTISTPYLVGSIHCYTGIFDGELVLFDTGPPTNEARRYLQDHLDLGDLRHVIITHCHIDHFGQAAWLEQNCDAVIYLPFRDSLKINGQKKWLVEMQRLLVDFGFDQKYLDALDEYLNRGKRLQQPKEFLVVEDDLPDRLGIEVLACPGHSQSDLVYVGDGWAVTGDTLLKGVFQSPLLDVDLKNGGRFKNYEAYCASIIILAGLKGKTIMQAHRQVVIDINETILFYISKLLKRVEHLHPYRTEENMMVLIDKLLNGRMTDTMHIFLKCSEIIFMKDFLQHPDLLRRSLVEIGIFHEVEELFEKAISR